jgi:hypothetical protein
MVRTPNFLGIMQFTKKFRNYKGLLSVEYYELSYTFDAC